MVKMMTDEMFVEKYEELLDKGYCDCNEMNCLANNVPRKILNIVKGLRTETRQLKVENQQLKSQLKQRDNVIDECKKHVSSLNSKGRDCMIYADVKKDILDILNKCKGDNK